MNLHDAPQRLWEEAKAMEADGSAYGGHDTILGPDPEAMEQWRRQAWTAKERRRWRRKDIPNTQRPKQ